MRRIPLLLPLFAIVAAVPLDAYLKFGVRVDGRSIDLKWSQGPIRYFATDRPAPGVTVSQFQAALQRAFGTWEAVPGASVAFQFAGFTSAEPSNDGDGMTTLGFLERPELDRVLGATEFTIDTRTGELVESDVFFNSAFSWSVAAAGEPDRYDLESIAVHEIGHLLGLGHSALGETELIEGGRRHVVAAGAVMFPIAFSAGNVSHRSLGADDTAGVTDLYPAPGIEQRTGGLSGRVTLGGRGIFGAHVIAQSLQTGALVAGFTLNDQGDFAIAALEPGPYVLRVEPLDDADLDSFFGSAAAVEVGFRPTFYDRVIAVPRGGGAREAVIEVDPK